MKREVPRYPSMAEARQIKNSPDPVFPGKALNRIQRNA